LAGIYIHIPFCKQACYYCDFHFSSYLALKDKLINALVLELERQKDFFTNPVETIYFGGGTPSLLNADDLEKIFSSIHKNYSIVPSPEITLEANPDDMTVEKLRMLMGTGINRLSMGIQTFNNDLLKYLNRIHTSNEAIESFNNARSIGFNNINCDLIYAIPGQDDEILERDLEKMIELHPEHISAYCLTIEERTVFGNWLKKNKFQQMEEDQATDQMEKVWDFLASNDYEQYEISNFCRSRHYSQHNSAYWKDKVYLGIGPGAHSYNGKARFYNISNNNMYIQSINKGLVPCTLEEISEEDRINEYILTSLRAKWGCDLEHLKTKYGINLLETHSCTISTLLEKNLIEKKAETLSLTNKGKLLADHIASKLFVNT
jgi:oxygen-independent coproporphyrinogen III oxidase